MRKMTKYSYKKMLRAVGLRATPARLYVLAHLAQAEQPLSVDALQKRLKHRAPHTVTLYRMMQDFLTKGLVRRVDFGQENAFFEFASQAHHHHIVCTQCGFIEDFSGCAMKKILERAQKHSTGFVEINEHHFELFGICKKCAPKNKQR